MNDLELLTRLRPQVDDPDPVTLARHRFTLLTRANGGPAPRRRRLPRLAIGGGALVAGAAVLALVLGLVPGGSAPLASAAVLLNNAADAADAGTPGQGEWTYTNTLSHLSGQSEVRTETWMKVDGSEGLVRTDRDGKHEERRVLVPAALAKQVGDRGGSPLAVPSYANLLTLPTDPVKLKDEIYRAVRTELDGLWPNARKLYTEDQWAYQKITGLVMGPTPPGVRANLYRVAAMIPGVEVVDNATDALGRSGVGVAHTENSAGDKVVLIFDRNTYQVLGMKLDGPSRGMSEAEALLASGLVAAKGQTP
ncbi:CU044_5270 family protein [Amycolatopsis cynarae]|uniref:CU044_5270 family protein n=1 Tax=Amycolatopsis cynarae TaxID=2995223 RepID=A0ABY7AX69_9PSEU|nr:CU044_5270 family protein [Amycolatopsis sp. HUAS 11-8]WAL64622.1 CU044_5270 family protein [Amycolatopsis sp. HUAS 11-8]